jgi:hypothetical protein
MIAVTAPTSYVVKVIQLAIAPVFLLSGVGVYANILTGRLARIIDHAQLLEDRFDEQTPERQALMRQSLARLAHRARMVNVALTLIVTCALLVCLIIALLFVGSILKIDFEKAISIMFVTAMLALVGSLGIFLREIFLGTAQLRIGRYR